MRKMFLAALAAAVSLCAGFAQAGEGCLLPGKLKKLPVPVVRAQPGADGYAWVLFQDVPLDGLPGTPRADIYVGVTYGSFSVKVKRDLGGNALDVSHYDCYVTGDSRVRIYASGYDVTFFVTADFEKERWKRWQREYRDALKKKRQEAEQARYRRLAPPTLND